MGASEWIYSIPYQADFNKAIRELQEQDFRNHGYYNVVTLRISQFKDMEFEDYNPYEHHPRYRFTETEFARWKSTPQPEAIEDLIKIQGDSGTHCIIDIDGISSTPEYRKAFPLSKEQLLKVFGTEKPNREAIESSRDQLREFITSWTAIYLVALKDDLPSEIFFLGIAGD